MLPPELAHGALSLNQGEARNAVTLWMVEAEDTGAIREDYYASSSPAPTTFPMAATYKHERTAIVNGNATTYDALRTTDDAFLVRVRSLLVKMSTAAVGSPDHGGGGSRCSGAHPCACGPASTP